MTCDNYKLKMNSSGRPPGDDTEDDTQLLTIKKARLKRLTSTIPVAILAGEFKPELNISFK